MKDCKYIFKTRWWVRWALFSLLLLNTYLNQPNNSYYCLFLKIGEQLSLNFKPLSQPLLQMLHVNTLEGMGVCQTWISIMLPGQTPVCDLTALSLHILALCLDCIRGLCWSMIRAFKSKPIFVSMPAESVVDASGSPLLPPISCCSAPDKNTLSLSGASGSNNVSVLWITGQTGLTRSTKRSKAFNEETQTVLATHPISKPDSSWAATQSL